MATWTRQAQECEGDYGFSGQMYITDGVLMNLLSEEINAIIADLEAFIAEWNGGDYLQVYVADDGRKIWCIDQLSRAAKANGHYTPAQLARFDYWTMLMPDEY